ncbi:MAG TPA: hypothetical protein VE134_02865, partial [Methanomicrobiales archaeon]|nr:hypothetical protein [Methanomicrobiales archaeon]
TSMGESKPRETAEPPKETKTETITAEKTGETTPVQQPGPWSQPAPMQMAPFTPDTQPPRALDEHLLEALRAQVAASEKSPEKQPKQTTEKIRLQKVHRLFEWTGKAVKKYGHDRLEMMLDSYRAMGYIEKEQRDQVKEIARLMPASLGDLHEIGPDEFVQELYSLNRILDPNDTTLDRDMIEVLMEQKRRGVSPKDKVPLPEEEREESWLGMQDRV